MAKRVIYHVLCGKTGWDVKREGVSRPAKTFKMKDRAVKFGRRAAASHQLGQLKVHRTDGKIQTEYTYGRDPKRYPS